MATKIEAARKRSRKAAAESIPDTPNPVDIAMMAAVSGKRIPDVAKRLLEEEARLIHAQCTELRLREIGERVRAALWAILAVAAFLIVGLIVLVVTKAARSDALVVESFRVPPSMAQQGLTGDVVASEVLDRIAEFQQKTDSVRAATSYSNNWGDDLKIDIPETGATADQIWKLLRGWLGKETRISGEVIQTPAGLALTTRVGSAPGERFVSKTSDLDSLIGQGAEHIMRATQPYRFVWYLSRSGRDGEAVAQLQQLTSDPSPIERKWAFNGISVFLRQHGHFDRSIEAAEQALAIDPTMIPATVNAGSAEQLLGHNQKALDRFNRALATPNTGEYDQRILDANGCNEREFVGSLAADQSQIDQALACFATAPESYRAFIPQVRWELAMLRHDPALVTEERSSAIIAPQEAAADNALIRLQMLLLADQVSRNELAMSLADFQRAEAQRALPKTAAFVHASELAGVWPLEARALSKTGRTDQAVALIRQTPLDCYDCLRARGSVAQDRGDFAGAQRWFLKAAEQGPRLPQAFLDWGRLLLQAGHYAPAEVKLHYAAKLAPRWADPLKYWGDALAAEGRRQDAIAKYDAALKLAPNWQDLQSARASLAKS